MTRAQDMDIVFKSLAELKRALRPGVELEVVQHWANIAALSNVQHRELATARRRITAASGSGYRYELQSSDGGWAGDHKNPHVPAADVTLHDDGSWSTDYGATKDRAGVEHRKIVRLRIAGAVR